MSWQGSSKTDYLCEWERRQVLDLARLSGMDVRQTMELAQVWAVHRRDRADGK